MFFEALAPGGFLCLGHSESMSRISSIFVPRKFRELDRLSKAIVRGVRIMKEDTGSGDRRTLQPVTERSGPGASWWSMTASPCACSTASVLEAAGFVVEEAINGVEGYEKALTQPFDLMIVDINMPKMDGYSMLRAIRGVSSSPRHSGGDDQHRGRRPRCDAGL